MRRWTTVGRVWSDFQSRNSFFLIPKFLIIFNKKSIFRFLNEIFRFFRIFFFGNSIQKELNFETDLNIAQHAKIENFSSASEILEMKDMTGMMMRQV